MNDTISRQAAIDAIDRLDIPEDMCVFEILSHIELEIGNLPSAQPERIQNNAVHLCDSCQYTYVTCPSHGNDAVFGDGKGYDNICACNKYRPISAQPEQTDCEYCHEDFNGYVRSIEKNSHAWLVRRGRTMKLHVCFKGGYSECDILFCPMCGRRLTEWD